MGTPTVGVRKDDAIPLVILTSARATTFVLLYARSLVVWASGTQIKSDLAIESSS